MSARSHSEFSSKSLQHSKLDHYSYREKYPSFRFKSFVLAKSVSKADFGKLIDFFKKLEARKWHEIEQLKGFDYKSPIKNKKMKEKFLRNLPEDATLRQLRIDKKSRIYGYRNNTVFYALYYDPKHEICET